MPRRNATRWVDGYGHDITTADGGRAYRTLALLLGIGSALFYAEWGSSTRPEALPQARHRLDTLLARRPFPWDWAPVDAVTTAPADTVPSAVNQPAPT